MTITLESISELLKRGFIDAYDDPGQVKASLDAAIRERNDLWSKWQTERCFRAKAEAELAALKTRMRPVARVENGEVRALMDPADEGKCVAVAVVEE
ncbi:MAG TPA: hypothetical protein VFI32_03215 [Rhodanobacteraceae bacterium]|nr:hypothetical protein [Rhodanobacteraceae bacterium]